MSWTYWNVINFYTGQIKDPDPDPDKTNFYAGKIKDPDPDPDKTNQNEMNPKPSIKDT